MEYNTIGKPAVSTEGHTIETPGVSTEDNTIGKPALSTDDNAFGQPTLYTKLTFCRKRKFMKPLLSSSVAIFVLFKQTSPHDTMFNK